MVYEAAALENDIPLYAVNATVEADFDPRGVAGAPVNPRIRAFRVTVNVDGPTLEEAEFLADEWRARCPIYTTFERAAPIEITNNLMMGEEMEAEEEAAVPAAPALSTAKATVQLSNQFGRSLISAHGQHFLLDSAPPLGHPAQETNPVEAMLGALATCGLFIFESTAQQMGIPLDAAQFTVQSDFDVRGLTGAADVDPHIQQFRIHIDVEGPSAEETATLVERYKLRCPIYTTLEKTAPIEVTVNDEEAGGPMAEGLATGTVSAVLSNQPGRAILNVRENFLPIESVPLLGGTNEGVNPMDLLLAAQGTCGTFIMEKAAMDMEIPFHGATGIVEADFNPQGMVNEEISPAIQAMRVHWLVGTDSEENAQTLVDQWLQRCPIYNTLIRATDIEVSHEVMGEGAAVLEVDFTYAMTAEEFVAEVSPLADVYAAVDGMIWKIWKINENESRAGAVYLFKDTAARQAYLDSELAAAIANHPALSDFRIDAYDVVRAESMMTRAPLMGVDAMGATRQSGGSSGVILEINFAYNVSAEDFMAEVSPLAEEFAASEGLVWKIWAIDEENSQFSGILYFDDADSMNAFSESDLAATILEHPALSDFNIMPYDILEAESTVTRAPIQ
jgi:uncharacterized OsmC-like protein